MAGRMVRAGALLTGLVLVLSLLPASHGQTVSLQASDTGQVTPISVYFAEGQSTVDIGSIYLPSCLAQNSAGQLVRLEKEDGSLRITETGPISTSSAILNWNFTAHPTLSASYNGTYVCRINASASAAMYHLYVVKRLNVTLLPSTVLLNDTGEKYSIMASVSGATAPFSTNWTSSVSLATQEPGLTSFSFRSNDSGITVDSPFTVSLAARYQPAIPCAGSVGAVNYALRQSVIDNCITSAMPSQATTTVTVQRTPCPAFHTPNNFINPVASAVFNTIAMISCVTGYSDPMPTSIQCMAGGEWSAQPVCTPVPVDECMTGDNNCMENCTDTTPGYTCVCFNGTVGCLVGPTLPPTIAATTAAATSSVSDMITMRNTPTSSTLDTGAIAGIAVGGAILMALIAGLIIYFAVKRDSCARLIWRVNRRPSTSLALPYCPTAPPSTLQKDGIPASEDEYQCAESGYPSEGDPSVA